MRKHGVDLPRAVTVAFALVTACGTPEQTPRSEPSPTIPVTTAPARTTPPATATATTVTTRAPALTYPNGSNATRLILVRWADEPLGAITDSGAIGPGHGVAMSTSAWTPEATFDGKLSTYTDPSGKERRLVIEQPLLNLTNRGSTGFGLTGGLGTYTLHFALPAGVMDIPLTLTQDVVDLQQGGARTCPVVTNMADLAIGFSSSIRAGETAELSISGWTTACDRTVVTIAGLIAPDGRVIRATGAGSMTAHPKPLRWLVPLGTPSGTYTALIYYPAGWRQIPLTVR